MQEKHQTLWNKDFTAAEILTQCVRLLRAAKKWTGAFDGGTKSSQLQAPGCGVHLFVLQDKFGGVGITNLTYITEG